MAQINLLKQNTASFNGWEMVIKVAVRILVSVLVLLLAYYGYLFLNASKISQQISQAKTQIATDTQNALNVPGRDELLTRQQQLKSLNGLMGQHVYFSHLLPRLAEYTLKVAAYSNLKAAPDGSLTLSVNLPALQDIDKYLQVFDLPEVNKYFSNVRIGSFHKVLNNNSTSYSFEVNLQFDPAIIQYNAVTK